MDNHREIPYSFSEVVNEIDGDREKGIELIKEAAQLYHECLLKIEMIEKEHNQALNYSSMLLGSALNVVKHLKKELPIQVISNGKILKITASRIIIEDNIL